MDGYERIKRSGMVYIGKSLESFPKVGSQIVADMEIRKGWSRSTTLTMLRRMTEKGLIFVMTVEK